MLAYVFEWVDRTSGGPAAWGWENAHRLEIALVLAVFTLCGVCATPFVQRWLGNPLLAFFSDISYNVYLWNGILMAYLSTHMQLCRAVRLVRLRPALVLRIDDSRLRVDALVRTPADAIPFRNAAGALAVVTTRRPVSTNSAP